MIWDQKEPCFAEQIEGLIRRGKNQELNVNYFNALFDTQYPIPYEELASTIKYIVYNIFNVSKSDLPINVKHNGSIIIRYNSCELHIFKEGMVQFSINKFDDTIINTDKPNIILLFRYLNHNQRYMEIIQQSDNPSLCYSIRNLGIIKDFNDLPYKDGMLFHTVTCTLILFLSNILYNIYLQEVKK